MKVEVAFPGSPSLIVPTGSVDVKQHCIENLALFDSTKSEWLVPHSVMHCRPLTPDP